MSSTPFDNLTDLYEGMIDWPKRLAYEAPFFRQLFEQAKVKRLADVACGTGRHADLFRTWGLKVQASDISPSMIQRAREMFGESEGLNWKIQGFDQPVGLPGTFDAAVCLGNSLALSADEAAAAVTLRQMIHALRPGGLVIIHVLNVWKLPPGPCVWQKLVRRPEQSLLLKGVHRCDDAAFVELVVIDPAQLAPIRSHSVRFLGLKAPFLHEIARASGADEVTFFGNHQQEPYHSDTSADLIMVAKKSGTLPES